MNKLKKIISMTAICSSLLIFGMNDNEAEALKYFSQTPQMISSNTPYGDNQSASHYVKSDDAKIYYEVYGQGDPIVILHGGGLGCAYEMGCFIDKLKVTNQVIVISTRGHGKSEIGHKPFTLKQRADDIQAVLKDFNVKKSVTMIGFSDGGYSGYSFAVNYPDRVKKLITIGAGEVLKTNKFFVFDLNAWRKFDAEFIDQQKKLMPEPDRWQEMLHMYEDMWNNTIVSREIFSKIKCPVLLINGENDPNSPMTTAIAAYYELPNANISIIPNTSHACFLENFNAVWSVIEPFINVELRMQNAE